MLAEEVSFLEEVPELNKRVLDIELINGQKMYSAIRGDELLFVEFSVLDSKIISSKRSNTLHPSWNESKKLHFHPDDGKSVDLNIKVLVDINGKNQEIANDKLKGIEKTLKLSVPYNVVDFKFGKERKLNFTLTALNFGQSSTMSKAKKMSSVAEEFSKYVTHIITLMKKLDEDSSGEKLEKIRADLDHENYLVQQKRIKLDDLKFLDGEIRVFQGILKDLKFDLNTKLTKEKAVALRGSILGNTILSEMYESFKESMTPVEKKKKKKSKIRSFLKGVKKRTVSKLKNRSVGDKVEYVYAGNLRFIYYDEIAIHDRIDDFRNRGKWKGIDVLMITYPTSRSAFGSDNFDNLYTRLQLLAKLSLDLPVPRIYGIVSSEEDIPDELNPKSDDELIVKRLKSSMSILVDEKFSEYSLENYLETSSSSISYDQRMKLVLDLLESLKLLHEDDFVHGYLSSKNCYFRVPQTPSIKKKKRVIIQVDPSIHPLVLGQCYFSLIDRVVQKPINRETIGFVAPEIVRVQYGENRVPTYTEESDVFSFGMCVFVILGGSFPSGYDRLYGRNCEKTLSSNFPKLFDTSNIFQKDPWIRNIVIDCIKFDPSRRPSMRKIMNRFRDEIRKQRGPVVFYCRGIDEDDADAEEMTLSEYTLKGMRKVISETYGEKKVIQEIIEKKDDGTDKLLKWNQDVYDIVDNAMIVVKFAKPGTKVYYPDEEEEEENKKTITKNLSNTELSRSIKKKMSGELKFLLERSKQMKNAKPTAAAAEVNEKKKEFEEEDEIISEEEEVTESEDEFEKEPIVFYLRSIDEEDDDADDFLMNDFKISELKSIIYKARNETFIKKIFVVKDSGEEFPIFTDQDIREHLEEDDSVIVEFGNKEDMLKMREEENKRLKLQIEERRKRKFPNKPKRKAPTIPQKKNEKKMKAPINSLVQKKPANSLDTGKVVSLQEENMKLKEELMKYRKTVSILEKKVEDLLKLSSSQKKEIDHLKLNMFKDF